MNLHVAITKLQQLPNMLPILFHGQLHPLPTPPPLDLLGKMFWPAFLAHPGTRGSHCSQVPYNLMPVALILLHQNYPRNDPWKCNQFYVPNRMVIIGHTHGGFRRWWWKVWSPGIRGPESESILPRCVTLDGSLPLCLDFRPSKRGMQLPGLL